LIVVLPIPTMKLYAVFLVALFVVSAVAEIRPLVTPKPKKTMQQADPLTLNSKGEVTDPLECQMCVEFMNNAIYDLEQIIVNGGVFDGCGNLCVYLNNQVEQVICNLLCDYVGVESFVALLNEADPDSIYYCQSLTVCPIQDYIKAKVNYVRVNPTAGPVGTRFNITYSYTLSNTTGTTVSSMIVLMANPLDDAMGDDELLITVPAGTYTQASSIWANPNPVTGEDWSPGQYLVTLQICEGTCESSHPHAYFLGYGQVYFQVFDGTTSS